MHQYTTTNSNTTSFLYNEAITTATPSLHSYTSSTTNTQPLCHCTSNTTNTPSLQKYYYFTIT